MPLHHHGGTPHTKTQQRKRTDDEVTLEQAAGDVQHDINAEPFNVGRWDRAVDDHIAGYRPAPTTGGTMPAQEDAERLRIIASSQEFPTPLLRAADQAFEPILAEVLSIIGEQSQHRETVQGAASTARDLIDNAIAATMAFEAAIHDAADGHARG